jgi:IS5 family transposase
MKDHVLVDGRGIPLSLVVTAANVNDHLALPELLNNHAIVRPRPSRAAPQHICLDAAFDNETTRQTLCREYYVPHIAPKGGRPEDAPLHPGGQARRWVVERTHAWFDRFRRLVVNWEKPTESRACLSLFGQRSHGISPLVCVHALSQIADLSTIRHK